MSTEQKRHWAVIGAGNGGQAVAGYLGLQGHSVSLYDISPETIAVIIQQGGIHLEGEVTGFGSVKMATTILSEAIADAEMIMVVTPALAHHSIAESCAPYLKDGQTIFLHPGATLGALAFKKALENAGCKAQVTIAESSTLIFACRLKAPGTATILGFKNKLLVSTLPAKETENVVSMLHTAFPQISSVPNVLFTSLDNTNPLVHPGPMLFALSMVESNKEWLFYRDGITPTISQFIEALDRERMAIGNAFGLQLISLHDQYKVEYGVFEDDLYHTFQNTKAYDSIQGSNTLQTRYLLEDIPMGLVPLVALGKIAGVPVDKMETIIKLGEFILNIDFSIHGRTPTNLGIEKMNIDQIVNYLETGTK